MEKSYEFKTGSPMLRVCHFGCWFTTWEPEPAGLQGCMVLNSPVVFENSWGGNTTYLTNLTNGHIYTITWFTFLGNTFKHKYWLHLTLRVDLTIDLMIYSDISAFSDGKHAHIFFSSLMQSILSDCNLNIQLCLSPYCPNSIKHQNDIFTDLEKQLGHWFQL